MPSFSLPLTQLIRENLSIVLTFAYSRQPLESLVRRSFHGEWKLLRSALFDLSEQRATKASLELALFLRLLDDDEGISRYADNMGTLDFGHLVRADSSEQQLTLRDVCNKILHASSFEWRFMELSDPPEPYLICNSKEPDRWIRAEIDVLSIASFCGQLLA